MIYDREFKLEGEKAVIKSFRDAQYKARNRFDLDMEKRMMYYKGAQHDELFEQLHQQYPKVYQKMKPLLYMNFYRKLINAMSKVYTDPPTRALNDGTDNDQMLFERVYNDGNINRKMKMAERWTNMFITSFAQWRYDSIQDMLCLDLIEPQRIQVIQGYPDPTCLDYCPAVIVELRALYDTIRNKDIKRFQYWSAGPNPHEGQARSFIYNIHGQVEEWPDEYNNSEGLNVFEDPETGYYIYPIMKFDFEEPSDFFDVGGEDLIALCENLDQRLVDIMYGAKMQAFSIPVLVTGKTFTGPVSIPWDPGLIVKIEQDAAGEADFHFVTPDPKLQELLNMVKELFELEGKLKDADPASIRLSSESSPESGYAKYLEKSESLSARRDRIDYWRSYEQDMARKGMIVWNASTRGSEKFSDAAIIGGIRVDFQDIKPELSPVEEMELDRMKQQDNIISIVDRMQKHNTDLDDEQAEQTIRDNKSLNDEIMGRIDPKERFEAMVGKSVGDKEDEDKKPPFGKDEDDEGDK